MLARTGRSQAPGLRASSSQAPRRTRGQRGGTAGCGASAFASRAASPPRSGPLGPEGAHTNHPRHPEGNCNSSVFFFFFFRGTSLRRLFVLFCFGGQSGVRKSKHKTNPEGIREVGAAQARGPGAKSEAPRASSAPAPWGPRGRAGRSAVVLAGVEARGRALQAAVAERRVLFGLEPQAG